MTPKIYSAINFAQRFFGIIDASKRDYKANKLVLGRLPEVQPIVILGDSTKGLVGFQSFFGSWIKISDSYGAENFAQAMNLTFSSEPEEITALSKKLRPFEEERVPVGKEFEILKEEILQTKDKSLIRNLAVVYYNWANNTAEIAEKKTGREKETLLAYALHRYYLSIQIDPTFGRAYHNRGTAKLKSALFKSQLDHSVRWEAIEDISRALQYEPLMFEAHLNLGKLHYEISLDEKDLNGKMSLLNESVEWYNRAIEIYPKDPEAFQDRGKIHSELAVTSGEEKQKNFQQAIQDYETAIELKPQLIYFLGLSTVLGEFAEFDKDQAKSLCEKSIQTLDHAEKIFEASTDIKYRLGNKYVMMALLTEEEKYLEIASSAFEDALTLDDENVKAWNNLGHWPRRST